jgi:hypothetical protein
LKNLNFQGQEATAIWLCGRLLSHLVLIVRLEDNQNWGKPQLSASFGLWKSVAEEVDVGIRGNRWAQEI